MLSSNAAEGRAEYIQERNASSEAQTRRAGVPPEADNNHGGRVMDCPVSASREHEMKYAPLHKDDTI